MRRGPRARRAPLRYTPDGLSLVTSVRCKHHLLLSLRNYGQYHLWSPQIGFRDTQDVGTRHLVVARCVLLNVVWRASHVIVGVQRFRFAEEAGKPVEEAGSI